MAIQFIYGFGFAVFIFVVIGVFTIKWLNHDEKRVEKEKQRAREQSKESIRVRF